MTARLAKRIDRQGWMRFFTHLTVILLIFVLPELMFRYSRPHGGGGIWSLFVYFKTFVYLAIFYINYFLILDRSFFTGKSKFLRFVAVNTLVVLVATVLICIVQYYVSHAGNHPRPIGMDKAIIRNASFVLRDVAMMLLTIGLSAALKFGERWSAIEERHEKLLASQRADELQNLKNQINPHFLFNTLNTIYALVEVSPAEAQKSIKMLSSLLRYALYENPATVKLSREVEFIKNYISLMEMRLGGGKVDARFSITPEAEPDVAPLLFITLVENAFKHGNTGHEGAMIEISIESDDKGNIVCRTSNSFIPAAAKNSATGGIGIANLRRRLHLLYPNSSSLDISIEGDRYISTLTIRNEQDQMLRD